MVSNNYYTIDEHIEITSQVNIRCDCVCLGVQSLFDIPNAKLCINGAIEFEIALSKNLEKMNNVFRHCHVMLMSYFIAQLSIELDQVHTKCMRLFFQGEAAHIHQLSTLSPCYSLVFRFLL